MAREEAIDILKTMWQVSTKGGPIEEALEIAIQALHEPHWILCSKKLPDKMLSTYLVTDNEGDVYICGWASGKWVGAPREIIAWMLLPEPYKEGDAE